MFHDEHLDSTYPMLSQYAAFLPPSARQIVGREKEKQDLMAAMLQPEVCNAILLAPAGTGKAHPDDTLIPVDDDRGYTRIGDLVGGDRVFSETGGVITVSGVFPRGELPVFILRTSNGCEVPCNDGHLWDVIDTVTGEHRVMELREIMEEGLYLDHEGGLGVPRWRIPGSGALQRRENDLPLDPWLAGLLLGACSRGPSGELCLDPSVSDQDVERAVLSMTEVVPVEGSWVPVRGESGEWFMRGTDSADRPSSRRLMVDDLCTHPLITQIVSRPRRSRRVPRPYLVSSVDQRRALIEGLNATRGVIPNGPCGFTRDVIEVVRSLGTPDGTEVFITEVVDTGRSAPMTCIMVDSPTHLYQVTRDHVVTHNTALVQACMADDTGRTYLEIDVAKLVSNLSNPEEMAARLKELFNEAESFSKREDRELVLFMDEFHQIVLLSTAAVEALKPLLAMSGARGIRVIAATTFDEFQEHISANLPLVERLVRINISPMDRPTTVRILKEMAARYGVADRFYGDHVYNTIVELTNRYVPASVQPRKSIMTLNAMIGRHRLTGAPMDAELLAQVLESTYGVKVNTRVDATRIKEQLDSRVYAQDMATSFIARRLQLCIAGLQNPDRPMMSLLFTGSTGVGKTEVTKQLARILFGDDQRHLIRFDMSEWGRDSSVDTFREELASAVWSVSNAIVLFDEVEKASPLCTRLLLQILDDGRLSDRNGRQVSFLNSYIILTTNAGSEIYNTIADYNVDDSGSEEAIAEYRKVIEESIKSQSENRFPPELLGRIDALIPFQPLSRNTLDRITMTKIKQMAQDVMRLHGVRLGVSGRVKTFLVEDEAVTAAESGGARDMVRKLDNTVKTEVAAFINAHPDEKNVFVDIEGTMRNEDTSILKSTAKVVVGVRQNDGSQLVRNQ